jgi:predicted ATPase/DNA-binding SARP family transcriptional activator
MPRDQVMDALWPYAAPDSALNALYTALHVLRRTLEPDLRAGRESAYVQVSGGSVGLCPIDGSYVDVDAFRQAMERAELADGSERATALREALAIYGGDLLADEPYVDWPVAIRERLRRDWRRAILDLAELEREASRPLAAVPALDALLAADPTDEAGHRALMHAQAAAGRRAEALVQYARCVRVLKDELDAEPSEDTTELARAIEAAAPSSPPVSVGPPLRPAGLPVPPTPLIGRAADLVAVRELVVNQGERLVTILGPGGIGKTRLAVEVARDASASFAGLVGFVPLASIRDPSLVIPTIAGSMGVSETADRSAADQLRDALYDREILLVIDNFEQVIGAAQEIAVLLEGNKGLRLLVTSREPLDLRAERRYHVAPLAVPSVPAGHSTEDLAASAIAEHAAVMLFIDRVQAAMPTFKLTDENAATVAAICARLDGLPLAIELAAVRCRHMSPPELLARLELRLPMLTGGPRDLPQRLRTMHDAIAWSHDLLDGSERRLFRRLSVFVGGCRIDAAESLAARLDDADAHATNGRSTLDLIGSLSDKSLLSLADENGGRIRVFETIREFGLEQLAASGDDEVTRAAHASLFLELAEQAAPELIGRDQAAWLARLEIEHDNLRSAFEWLLADDAPEGALRFCRALSRFWRMHGHYSEGRGRVERALERAGPSNVIRAWALVTAGDLAHPQGDPERAEDRYREALSIFSRHDDRRGMAEASLGLGAVALGQSELPVATEWTERALQLFRAVDDRHGAASALNYLATVAFHRGEFDRAAPLWQECLRLQAELGDDRARSFSLSNLGVLELERGHPEVAVAHHQAALGIARGLDDKWAITHPLINLGRVLVVLGRSGEARPLLEEALANCRDLGDPIHEALTLQNMALGALADDDLERAEIVVARSIEMSRRARDRIVAAGTLEVVAAVVVARGDGAAAARLLGAAEALREKVAAVRERADQLDYERAVAAIRAELEPAQFEAAWTAGHGDDFDAAMIQALSALKGIGYHGASPPGNGRGQ